MVVPDELELLEELLEEELELLLLEELEVVPPAVMLIFETV